MFPDIEDLGGHMLMVHGLRQRCSNCGEYRKDKEDLRDHKWKAHSV